MEKENLLKGVNLIVGLIVILLSILVIIFSSAALLSIIILLSIALLFAGIGRLYSAFADEKLNKIAKGLKIIVGILEIIISLTVIIITIIEPTISILLLINLFGLIFIVIGASGIAIGLLVEKFTKQYRFLLILIGIISFVFAFIVLFYPTFGYFVLVILLSLSLLFNGFARVLYALFEK